MFSSLSSFIGSVAQSDTADFKLCEISNCIVFAIKCPNFKWF